MRPSYSHDITGLLDRDGNFTMKMQTGECPMPSPWGTRGFVIDWQPFGQAVIQWTSECNCVITDDQDIYCLSI